MKYHEIRDRIETGDIILIRKKTGLIARMTSLFTRSPYTHAGITAWLIDGLWMGEINSGHNHLVPLSQFEHLDFDVFECPVNRLRVEKEMLESMRVSVEYSVLSFLVIGFTNLFKIKERFTSRKDRVCSEYIQKILINSGWDVPDKMISPYDLSKLLKLKFEVRA